MEGTPTGENLIWWTLTNGRATSFTPSTFQSTQRVATVNDIATINTPPAVAQGNYINLAFPAEFSPRYIRNEGLGLEDAMMMPVTGPDEINAFDHVGSVTLNNVFYTVISVGPLVQSATFTWEMELR